MSVQSTRRSVLQRIWQRLVDFLLPAACPLCGALAEGQPFCGSCLLNTKPPPACACPTCGEPYADTSDSQHHCQVCLAAPPAHHRYFCAGLFEGPLRDAIHRFKFDGRLVFDRALAHLLHQRLPEDLAIDFVVPVPLHRSRLRERGFNQSKLIAAQLCRRRRWLLAGNGLTRVRSTAPQQTLARTQRRTNLNGAFEAAPIVQGKRILLIDDVSTTGATLAACSRALWHAGAASVVAATVARARRHRPAHKEE